MDSDTKLHAQNVLCDIEALLVAANRLIRETEACGQLGVGEDFEKASRVIDAAIRRANQLNDELDALPLRRAA